MAVSAVVATRSRENSQSKYWNMYLNVSAVSGWPLNEICLTTAVASASARAFEGSALYAFMSATLREGNGPRDARDGAAMKADHRRPRMGRPPRLREGSARNRTRPSYYQWYQRRDTRAICSPIRRGCSAPEGGRGQHRGKWAERPRRRRSGCAPHTRVSRGLAKPSRWPPSRASRHLRRVAVGISPLAAAIASASLPSDVRLNARARAPPPSLGRRSRPKTAAVAASRSRQTPHSPYHGDGSGLQEQRGHEYATSHVLRSVAGGAFQAPREMSFRGDEADFVSPLQVGAVSRQAQVQVVP